MAIKKITEIRRPLVTINGLDFATGNPVDTSEYIKELDKNLKKKMQEVSKRLDQTKREDGKIFITGLGRVA